jgi:hypothetical protein
MTLPFKDVSIITQCAFKGAVEAGDDVTTDEGLVNFNARFAVLRETLFDAVNAEVEARGVKPAAVPTPAPARTTEDALAQELGATPMIEVVSDDGQQGAFPAWFLKAAAEAGVSRVYDNRAGLGENPKLPWFKCADTKKPFWPPKTGGRK